MCESRFEQGAEPQGDDQRKSHRHDAAEHIEHRRVRFAERNLDRIQPLQHLGQQTRDVHGDADPDHRGEHALEGDECGRGRACTRGERLAHQVDHHAHAGERSRQRHRERQQPGMQKMADDAAADQDHREHGERKQHARKRRGTHTDGGRPGGIPRDRIGMRTHTPLEPVRSKPAEHQRQHDHRNLPEHIGTTEIVLQIGDQSFDRGRLHARASSGVT